MVLGRARRRRADAAVRHVLFWLLVAATVGVYLAMVTWTLPTISADAGGLAPFDMRLFGYSFEEAKAFLEKLGPEGAALYRGVQHRLDLAFPALIAATLFFSISSLLPVRSTAGRVMLALLLLPVAIFDWLENAAVATLLAAGADGITPAMVAIASQWTIGKALVSTVAYSVLLVLLVRLAMRWWRGRRLGG